MSTIPLVASHFDNSLRALISSDSGGWLAWTHFGDRLEETNSEGRRTRTNSVFCLPFFNTASNNGNTGLPSVGYHATQQYRSGERIHVFDYGCLVTTDSSQTRHNIYIYIYIYIVTYYGWLVWQITWRGFGLGTWFIHYGDLQLQMATQVTIIIGYNYWDHYRTGSFSDPTDVTALRWRFTSRTHCEHWTLLLSATNWPRLTSEADWRRLTSETNWLTLIPRTNWRRLTSSLGSGDWLVFSVVVHYIRLGWLDRKHWPPQCWLLGNQHRPSYRWLLCDQHWPSYCWLLW
jgi:hypothetical protein